MIGSIRFVILFVFLILLQVLILNNLHLSILINPYAYILLILLLPFETPGWLVLSISFFLGMTMDVFSNSLGMHSAACVIAGFSRKYMLEVMAPRDGYEQGRTPHYSDMGLIWFLIYAGILTFLHHLSLFLIEDFRMYYLLTIIPKAIISSVLTVALMLILLLFSYKQE